MLFNPTSKFGQAHVSDPECDREFPVPGILIIFGGTGKKSRNRYRNFFVPEKSPGSGFENI